MIPLVTTRFDNNTWRENVNYREKNNIRGIIYGVPQQMCQKIDLDALVFVVEMNNSKNHIEGISIIRNRHQTDKYYKIYSNNNFNRFTYMSEYRIDRNSLLEKYNPKIVEAFDHILFKEKTHLKRGQGFTSISDKLLRRDICQQFDATISEELKRIFLKEFKYL